MKQKHRIFVYILLAAELVSCTKSDSPVSENSIKLGIIGKWKNAIYDGKQLPTNEQSVCTYHVDGTYEFSNCTKDIWFPKHVLEYSVIDNVITVESKKYFMTMREVVSGITKDRLTISSYEATSSQGISEGNIPYEYIRIKKDFSNTIIGFWKGESMEGQQTFGDENHMWEYNDDGTYSYYSKQANGKWLPMEQDNLYVCDGDLLACRWKSNDTINVEWWDVESCDSQKMVWKALRKKEDGSTFETNFLFKRISDTDGSIMSPGFIKSQLPGRWKGIYRNGKRLATNDRGNYTFYPDGTGDYTAILLDAWDRDTKFDYSLTRNNIDISYKDASITKGKRMKVTSIDSDSLCVISNVSFGGSSSPFPVDSNFTQTYKRVTEDYSLMIIGLWEGVSMTGEDAYDVTSCRWKYNSDGTYFFYSKEGDKWVLSEEETSEYVVTGDWIICRWRKDARSDMNFERWDIDSCDSDTMVWSAIREREDGTQYTSTITYKRCGI